MIRIIPILLVCISFIDTDTVSPTPGIVEDAAKILFNNTRRILRGKPTGHTRPYMVYLRPIDRTTINDPTWTCGGVIIHASFILTSAACIEDVVQFLVVSGTHNWIRNDETSECIEYGAVKAISKCVPKEFVFDGHAFDNTKWMRDDIAVVKVEPRFNFDRRVRGCDYIPQPIRINNVSADLESSSTIGSIAGWGTTSRFALTRTANNSNALLEVDVKIISNSHCKNLWPHRYHHIIDYKIICTQDSSQDVTVKCGEGNCADVLDDTARRDQPPPLVDHEAEHVMRAHNDTKNPTRRAFITGGGFCHNDHGGPLIVGQGTNAVVVGIISACQHNELNHRCYGPFLYTSVWKNKHLINCVLGDKSCELEKWMSCCALEEEQTIRMMN